MRTREVARRGALGVRRGQVGVLKGFGHTAKVTGSALIASMMLIAAVAMVSVCWQIHPLLTLGVVAVLAWAGYRLASLLLTSGRRTQDRVPH